MSLAVVAASEVREEENSCSRELYSFVSSGEMDRHGLRRGHSVSDDDNG